MKPIGYRDLHGPSGGAYVFRLEQKQIGGFALAAGVVAVVLLFLGALFARSSSKPATVPATASPSGPRQPVFTAAVVPAAPSEPESAQTPEGEGLAPSIATPSEAPAPIAAPRRPASVPTKPAPARTPARPATRASAPPARRAATAPTPPSQWKPPTSYGFIVASFVVPTGATGESAALVTARKRGEAQVASLRKDGLTRARLLETRSADRVTYRVLADERRYYDREGAAERKADLRREHRFREVWVLPL